MRANANLWVFDADVFAQPTARLLRSYRISDWTSGLHPYADQIELTAESFLASHQGLDGPYLLLGSAIRPAPLAAARRCRYT